MALKDSANSNPDPTAGLDIRTGLRQKLLHFYAGTFKDLFEVFAIANDFDFLVLMNAIEGSMKRSSSQKGVSVSVRSEFDTQLILQEVFDDYWASLLCFQHGFTKQSQEVFRNTVELLIQLYYLRHLDRAGSAEVDRWVLGTRGIEGISTKLAALKEADQLKQDNIYSRLSCMYDRLCTATHSHKDRMMARRMARITQAGQLPSFDPAEILYTRALFLSLIDLELTMIKRFLQDGDQTEWTDGMVSIVSEMLSKLSKHHATIERFEKGYLVHQEHIKLRDGSQILYSVRTDGSLEYPGRDKRRLLTHSQQKDLLTKVEVRLLRDGS